MSSLTSLLSTRSSSVPGLEIATDGEGDVLVLSLNTFFRCLRGESFFVYRVLDCQVMYEVRITTRAVAESLLFRVSIYRRRDRHDFSRILDRSDTVSLN